jgi:hypothetical protein
MPSARNDGHGLLRHRPVCCRRGELSIGMCPMSTRLQLINIFVTYELILQQLQPVDPNAPTPTQIMTMLQSINASVSWTKFRYTPIYRLLILTKRHQIRDIISLFNCPLISVTICWYFRVCRIESDFNSIRFMLASGVYQSSNGWSRVVFHISWLS